MNEPAITAEDLTLYALQSLDGTAASRVELLLRSSSEARQELSQIRGDLAALGCSAPQHTPPALSRQRLLKQVAREVRSVPIPVFAEEQQFALDPPETLQAPVENPESAKFTQLTAEERRARVRLPRIVAEPEPIFSAKADEAPVDPAKQLRAEAPPQSAALPGEKPETTRPAEKREDVETPVRPQTPLLFSSKRPEVTADSPLPRATTGRAKSTEREPVTIFPALSSTDSLFAVDAEDRYEPSSRRSFVEEDAPVKRSGVAVVLGWAGWVAAAGLAAALLLSVQTKDDLQRQLRSQNVALARTQASAAQADLVLQTLESAASQRFVLARQDTAPIPSARVTYLADRGSLVFQGTNLEALQPYKTYELWLIPAEEGRQPIPAGTFKPDARGYATLVVPSLPKGTVAGNFGVTIEDETGSAAPTLPILLIGQG